MSKLYYDKEQQLLKVILEGELVIENLKEIKQSINDAFSHSSILIDHSLATEFDFSYLQLLVSAIKTAETNGKKLSFSGSENLKSLVLETGFNNTNFFPVI